MRKLGCLFDVHSGKPRQKVVAVQQTFVAFSLRHFWPSWPRTRGHLVARASTRQACSILQPPKNGPQETPTWPALVACFLFAVAATRFSSLECLAVHLGAEPLNQQSEKSQLCPPLLDIHNHHLVEHLAYHTYIDHRQYTY